MAWWWVVNQKPLLHKRLAVRGQGRALNPAKQYIVTVVCHTSDNMNKGIWIWKNRLTEVLTVISDHTDEELNSSSLDAIKYGLVGTSDEKNYWFDYKIGGVTLRLAIDNDDNDMVHLQITGLDDKSIGQLSDMGTKMN